MNTDEKTGSLMCTLVLLCVTAWSDAAVRIEQVDYAGYGPAWRVSNEEAEVVVVPGVGRIMRYALVGGQNALWENPNTKGVGGYWHLGGDKVWPWPQDEWREGAGGEKRGWPPPPGVDPLEMEVRVDGNVLVMASGVIPDYGVRLVREIRLAEKGSEVLITNRFEKVAEGRDDTLAVWTVTQVPEPELILARIAQGSTLEQGYLEMGSVEFKSIRREGNLFSIERSPVRATKIGLDAEMLASLRKGVLFVQEYVGEKSSEGEHQPGHRGQIYGNPDETDAHPATVPPYVELEFTSPMKRLAAKGESVSMTVRWSLKPVRGGDVARSLKGN